MGLSFSVRKLYAQDAAEYRRFVDIALAEDATAFRRNVDWWRKATVTELERILRTRHTVGAVRNATLLGTGALNVDPTDNQENPPWTALVTNVHVMLAERREGIGRAVLQMLIAEADRTPFIGSLELLVDAHNLAAVELYHGANFRTAPERRRKDDEPGVLRMRYPLSPKTF